MSNRYFTSYEAEDMILAMADIVCEVRRMRTHIAELEEENSHLKSELKDVWKSNEEFNREFFGYALRNALGVKEEPA